MNGHFEKTLGRLRLTRAQREDAKRKYSAVAKTLHDHYYDTEYTGKTKLLIGSLGKRTNIRPPGDVDLLFIIPYEKFNQYSEQEGNGQSSLLQEVRTALKDKYSTTERISGWGKVVLIVFKEGSHNVELLPAHEQEDGSFLVPDTAGEGSWQYFDPRAESSLIQESDEITEGRTRKLIRLIKRWKMNTSGLNIKSFEIEQAVVRFLVFDDSGMPWSEITAKFFSFLAREADSSSDTHSHITTASNRAQKALQYQADGNFKHACEEWRKIFGQPFPVYDDKLEKIHGYSQQYPSPVEEFIEDKFKVQINPAYSVRINSRITRSGFRHGSIFDFLQRFSGLPKNASVVFSVTSNIEDEVKYYWKIRNFGEEARAVNDARGLRGEITEDYGSATKKESTLYTGTHYVECYAIKDEVCVAYGRLFVPIEDDVKEAS